jgi:uncharacterized protein YjbI with pentapeptide repeats
MLGFGRLVEILQTDVGDLAEGVESATGMGKALLDIFKKIKENEDDSSIKSLIASSRASSLLELLNCPPVEIIGESLPFVSGVFKFIKLYEEHQNENAPPAYCASLVSQTAYLKSYCQVLSWTENQLVLERIKDSQSTSEEVKKEIKNLEEIQLTDSDIIRRMMIRFHESDLASKFNSILKKRFEESGLNEDEAKILTEKISRNTHRHLLDTVVELGDRVKNLQTIYPAEGRRKDIETYMAIDLYLEENIKKLPKKNVFKENFTCEEIYVPLNARDLDQEKDEPLESLVKNWLRDEESGEPAKVMFVQATPGRGKTLFCRMFAEFVRANMYPIWTPIFIELKSINNEASSLRAKLTEAVNKPFADGANGGWLSDRNTRFLFLLDGFDELPDDRQSSSEREDFLKSVLNFQKNCNEDPEMGHRVLITGRTLTLTDKAINSDFIDESLLKKCKRVEILEMNEKLQDEWLGKWEACSAKDPSPEFLKQNPEFVKQNPEFVKRKNELFRNFLKSKDCPTCLCGSDSEVGLAQEPLLLYLLASMYQKGHLDLELIINTKESPDKVTVKTLIYQKSLECVLTELRTEHNQEFQKSVKRILQEVGLCVVQLSKARISTKFIKERLKNDDDDRTILENDDLFRKALATFYLQQPADASQQEDSVEFVHKSFGEFLCAERLKNTLEAWIRTKQNSSVFEVSDTVFYGQAYDLFGYGGITTEILEYLVDLLRSSEEFKQENNILNLSKRLQDFYFRWCKGEFINQSRDMPILHKKIAELKQYRASFELKQLDVYAGLNVMILLLELYRYARREAPDLPEKKIQFWPCKDDKSQLLRIIGYSNCIKIGEFAEKVGPFLGYAKLDGADLGGAYLRGVNLERASLSQANLSGAYLKGANLKKARLKDANLRRVNLESADLTEAYLIDVNLSNADMRSSNLTEANLCGADLSNTKLDDSTFYSAYLGGTVLSTANLNRADMRKAILCSAVLEGTNLELAKLENADLRGANLKNSIWTWAEYSGAKGLDKTRYRPQEIKLQSNESNEP